MFFLRLRKRKKVKMKLNVNTTNSCARMKIANARIAWRCIQWDTSKDGRDDNGERETWKIGNSARRSTWIAFTSVNCVREIKWKSGRNETRNNCRRLSLYFTFVALDFFRVTKERGNTGNACISSGMEVSSGQIVIT